jgi:phosphohistidine swiveling domain-containing protein
VTVPEAAAAAQPIPLPPDFLVYFEPGEDQYLWERDRTHFPAQVTTLEGEFIADAIGRGMSHAMRRYEAPVDRMAIRILHGFMYQAMIPVTGTLEEMEARGRRAEALLMDVIGRLGEQWEEGWLPEIREHLCAMEATDPRAVTEAGLLAMIDDYDERLGRLWEIHFEIVLPAYIVVSEFDELYRDLLEGEGFDAYRLLHGFPTKTFEVGRDLWRLSRLALETPEVTAVLEAEAAVDIPVRLEEFAAGRAFLTELSRHLAEYGHRTTNWGLSTPSFIEDPRPVLKVLKDYVGQPDSADPAHELERLVAEREAAVAAARERLQGYPAAVAGQFEAMLEAAQVGLRLTEDHGFYIDAYAVSLARELLSEIGQRLAAAAVIGHPDDVLMLRGQEIREALADLTRGDMHGRVAERRSHLARYADVDPPAMLGTLPPGPPPDSPFTRLTTKFSGAPATPEEPGIVRGASGSAGTATGVARVVRSLADASRLKPGEILVAETTAPPWTPLFRVAAAVVTDTGGILSHSAVVAREYGIPAVVGAGRATTAIADGDVVEVDGDAGTVRIVRR